MIKLDCTTNGVVIFCEECRVWNAFAFDKLEAWERAAAHEKRCHPGVNRAQSAYLVALKRSQHAV